MEYWEDSDSDIDADFSTSSHAPALPDVESPKKENQDGVVWWITMFVCIFRSVHFLPDRAVAWLLLFLKGLFNFLGRYSPVISSIAIALPTSIHLLEHYMGTPEVMANVKKYVVCPNCHTLYSYNDCFDTNGSSPTYKKCIQRQFVSSPVCGGALLKTVVTARGNTRHYPIRVYCYFDFLFGLKFLLTRKGVMEICESSRDQYLSDDKLSDVYQGNMWKKFLYYDGKEFLCAAHNYAVLLNVDWFQPFKNINYSVGVLYIALLNLPRHLRYKRENIIIVGIIPGPTEPSLNINTYLKPLVNDLKELWDGMTICMPRSGEKITVRCVLLGVSCDLPAGRKVCGFLSYNANKACTKCNCCFSEGFGKTNFSNFNRDLWTARTVAAHRDNVKIIMQSTSKSEQSKLESQYGCRYSVLLELHYFDPIHMLLIDPMHNLFLGTAKRMTQKVWLDRHFLSNNDLQVIHRRLNNIALPSDLGRLPQHIESGSTFTAQQWKNWTLYFSVMCLFDLLPSEHFKCWQSYVLACRRLCQVSLSPADITVADGLFLKFCQQCVHLYGPLTITPNMHLHCHLSECIKDFGPSHAFWLFAFERYNGLLGKEPNNNRSIELQLMHRFLKDNLSLQFLSGSEDSPHADYFKDIVFNPEYFKVEHTIQDHFERNVGSSCVPAKKSSLGYLSPEEVIGLTFLYCKQYPELAPRLNNGTLRVSSSYHKFSHAFINGKKVSSKSENAKQPYIAAIPNIPFTNDQSCTENIPSVSRAAEILFFGKQVYATSPSEQPLTCFFASVRWPKRYCSHTIGNPAHVWYYDLFDYHSENQFIVPQSIVSRMVTLCDVIQLENVLITVPLVE